MSPEQKAEAIAARLRAEAVRDLEALERAVAQAESERPLVPAGGPSPGQLALLALAIDRGYSACEAVLLRIARSIDGATPAGPAWHAALLHQMTLPLQDVRPAVIEAETARRLDEWLRFRHFLRHAYHADLDWFRVRPLAESLADTAARFRNDLTRFLDAL